MFARRAAALEHHRLAMPADIGKELDAVLVAHERFGVAQPFQRLVVARVGHHQLVADVSRPAVEKQALLELVESGDRSTSGREAAAQWRGKRRRAKGQTCGRYDRAGPAKKRRYSFLSTLKRQQILPASRPV